MALKAPDIPPCLIYIDKEGHWYHEGKEMIHREFIRAFYQNMELDSHGRYIILWEGKRCYVDVEDTAFVVWGVQFLDKKEASKERILLRLSDDTEEDLIPETLWVGEANVLYCKVKKGTFPARFNRPAYYQLARAIEEEAGQFYLPLNGKRYPLVTQGNDPQGPLGA